MRTITITAFQRPALFRLMLESLRANDLKGWRVFIAIEPSRVTDEMVGLASEILYGVDHAVYVNETVLGISQNPYQILCRVFDEGSSLNLYLEEDLVLSPDTSTLALWYEKNHRPEWLCVNLLSGPCGSSGLLSNSMLPNTLFVARTFNSLGFAIRREEWNQFMEPIWRNNAQIVSLSSEERGYAYWRTHWGWDWSVYGLIAGSPTLFTVQPVFARSTHSGSSGTYMTPDFQEKAFSHLEINKHPQNDYKIMRIEELPRPIRSHIYLHDEKTKLLMDVEALAGNGTGRQ